MESARLQFTELVLKPCTLVYGSSPCTAAIGITGQCKCYNSPATCQDPANFLPGEHIIRFAVPTADLPVDYDYIPNIKTLSVTAQKINPGESLGTREAMTSTHFNHPHNDVCYDKYVSERGFNPFNVGTHWGKFAARWPNIQGFEYRRVIGFDGQAIEDMTRHYYYVDSTSGPDNSGGFSITAKDAIKFLDGDKALVPLPSTGVLLTNISNSETSLTLSPVGIGNIEYPSSGIASIGDETVSFTRVGDVVTLTGRELKGSKRDEHNEGETFQIAEVFTGVEPSAAIHRLLSAFTDTPAEYLDPAAWSAETVEHIGRLFSRDIMKPTSVKKIMDELIQQVGLIIYTNVIDKKIVVRTLRNVVPSMSLTDNSFTDQLTTKYDSSKRISQVLMFYAPKNPLEKIDDEKNYAAILNSFSGDPVAALESASPAIKKIYATWITIFNRPAAEAVSRYLLTRYGRAPRSVGFKLPVNIPLKLGSVFTLDSIRFEDSQGLKSLPVLFQAVSVEPNAAGCTVLGEQVPLGEEDSPGGVAVINIDEDSYNLNLRSVYDSIYTAPESGDAVNVYLAAGVIVGSLTPHEFSFTVGEWPAGVSITIYRLGSSGGIVGAGGGFDAPGFAGTDGGPALFTRYPITLVDCLVGGGGGGGGSSAWDFNFGAIGGGGAGRVPGLGWESGSLFTGGSGQVNGPTYGGQGGDLGEDGDSGDGGSGSPGGGAGVAIDGVSYVTLSGVSDIRGLQIN